MPFERWYIIKELIEDWYVKWTREFIAEYSRRGQRKVTWYKRITLADRLSGMKIRDKEWWTTYSSLSKEEKRIYHRNKRREYISKYPYVFKKNPPNS